MNEQGGRQVVGAPVPGARIAQRDREAASVLHPLTPVVDGRTGTVNVVTLALVAALLDLEQRRDRGKVRPPMDRDGSV